MTDEQLARLMRFQLAVADAIDVRLSLLIPAGPTADKCDDIVRDKFNLAKAMIEGLENKTTPSTVWILARKDSLGGYLIGVAWPGNDVEGPTWTPDPNYAMRFPSYKDAHDYAHRINLWKLLEPVEYQPPMKTE